MTSWESELERAVRSAVAVAGPAAVRGALDAQRATLADAAGPAPLLPDVAVLGIAATGSGWVGVLLHENGRATVHASASAGSLIDQARETVEVTVIVEATDEESPASAREALHQRGFPVPAWYAGSGFTEGDLLRACAAVLGSLET